MVNVFCKEECAFTKKHNRNLILKRGMKNALEYIVNPFLLAFFHLIGTCYQSLVAILSPYCISLPSASTLSVIPLHTQ